MRDETARSTPAACDAYDPYDADRPLMLRCSCGADHAPQDHAATVDPDALGRSFMEASLVKALFPAEPVRRAFLKAVGRRGAMAAIAAALPAGALTSLQAMAQDKKALEKKDLKIGFIPITCASPLIMADPLGFYRQQGLNVSLQKTAGWALIRDKIMNREYDATHFLSPMPVAISLGLGSAAMPMNVATIQNINGQAITLANKHKANRDPKGWKGFKFAIPFEFSMHNFLLRYYLAEHGLNPDTDVQLRVTPPAEMVANLRAGNIDGFLGPDPFNQRAVFEEAGFIHILSREIWDGHPCCAFGVPTAFIEQNPNTFAALYRAVLTAAAMARQPKDRELNRQGHRPGPVPEPARGGAAAGADRQVRRRPGQCAQRARAGRLRPRAVAEHGRVDADPDEALGLPEGRRQLQAGGREGVPADRRQEDHEGTGPAGARGRLQEVQGAGQGVRPGPARRLPEELRHPEGGLRWPPRVQPA